ncbi:hypothetical protein SKB0092_20330 [Roseomonas mucosa]
MARSAPPPCSRGSRSHCSPLVEFHEAIRNQAGRLARPVFSLDVTGAYPHNHDKKPWNRSRGARGWAQISPLPPFQEDMPA